MDAEQIPRIPQSACLHYLNEGAANIVYTIEVTAPTPPGSILEAYRSGTPPPEAIESYLDQEFDDPKDLEAVESTYCSCPFASLQPSACDPFSPLSVSDPRQITANITSDKLLRLRKDLPTTLPVARSQEAWVRVIEPLFLPDQVVRQSLVRLDPHLIDRMKVRLIHWENHPTEYKNPRPSRRKGAYLADDEFGLLITDMSAGT
jgi:inositol-pentakisphosphate 2-kinase